MNDVRMHLPQRDQRPQLALSRGSQTQQRLFAVALHAGAEIVFGKADVQSSAAIAGGEAAESRGESVDQPRKTF